MLEKLTQNTKSLKRTRNGQIVTIFSVECEVKLKNKEHMNMMGKPSPWKDVTAHNYVKTYAQILILNIC